MYKKKLKTKYTACQVSDITGIKIVTLAKLGTGHDLQFPSCDWFGILNKGIMLFDVAKVIRLFIT